MPLRLNVAFLGHWHSFMKMFSAVPDSDLPCMKHIAVSGFENIMINIEIQISIQKDHLVGLQRTKQEIVRIFLTPIPTPCFILLFTGETATKWHKKTIKSGQNYQTIINF